MKSKPFRMCIACRNRFIQSELLRLQCKDGHLKPYSGAGRSFYICKGCLDDKNRKAILKRVSNICKKSVKITELESIIDG